MLAHLLARVHPGLRLLVPGRQQLDQLLLKVAQAFWEVALHCHCLGAILGLKCGDHLVGIGPQHLQAPLVGGLPLVSNACQLGIHLPVYIGQRLEELGLQLLQMTQVVGVSSVQRIVLDQ
jgi:hypothetical protein